MLPTTLLAGTTPLGRRLLICAWTEFASLQITALACKVSWFSMPVAVVLDLVLDASCSSV